MKRIKYIIPFLVMILGLSSACILDTKQDCEDLLEAYAEKPTHLIFKACKVGEGQIIQEARYEVSIEHYKEVEQFIIDK